MATDEAHITRNEQKRYYETGETDAKPQNPQVTNQIDIGDLNVKVKKVDDMGEAWQNEQCFSDEQTDDTPDLSESEEPVAKRSKLGILPAYIPLG